MTADLLWAGDGLVPDAAYAAGERRSECSAGCPPYVVRCAHLDGDDRVVWLWPKKYSPGFGVALGYPNDDRRPPALGFDVIPKYWEFVPTRAEADRAFERFEAILMGRDPDDPRDDAPPTLQDEARWRAADDRWHDRQQARRGGRG